MKFVQTKDRSLTSLAEEAVRSGREFEHAAHEVRLGGNATDFAFVKRSLRRLAERDPFDPRDEASLEALSGILEADLAREVTGTEQRFFETRFDELGQHGELRDVPLYTERGQHLLRVRRLLSTFLKARAAALDAIAAETALQRLLRV